MLYEIDSGEKICVLAIAWTTAKFRKLAFAQFTLGVNLLKPYWWADNGLSKWTHFQTRFYFLQTTLNFNFAQFMKTSTLPPVSHYMVISKTMLWFSCQKCYSLFLLLQFVLANSHKIPYKSSCNVKLQKYNNLKSICLEHYAFLELFKNAAAHLSLRHI